MVNRYCRQTCLTLLLAGGLVVGSFTDVVSAQHSNSVEVLVGGGNTWTPRCLLTAAVVACDVYALATYEIGGAFWWNDHWGLAWRQEFNPHEYSLDPPPFTSGIVLRQKNMRGHSLTARGGNAVFLCGFRDE